MDTAGWWKYTEIAKRLRYPEPEERVRRLIERYPDLVREEIRRLDRSGG